MRRRLRDLVLPMSLSWAACAAPNAPKAAPHSAEPRATAAAKAEAPPQVEKIEADTPKSTAGGVTFVAPKGWTVASKGSMISLEPPEGDSHIAFVETDAKDADAAVAAAWALYKPNRPWEQESATSLSDKNGWSERRRYVYRTSPNERRSVSAVARRASGKWLVSISDMLEATDEKRVAQIDQIFGRLYPKGYAPESFAGKKANQLDAARVKEIVAFVEKAQKELSIPGAALGLVQDGKIVFAGGLGVREIGKPAKVDEKTLFLVASNTKQLTTLMLAKLVDAGALGWETPVIEAAPQFKLGDKEMTSSVRIKHLVCACTGLPRQDFEWLLEFKPMTPASLFDSVGAMQPTSKLGEMFQYSNPLAAIGGYVGGRAHAPKLELGAAYDKAMQSLVFDPLGMKSTTFDFTKALAANHAAGHAQSIDDKTEVAVFDINRSAIPMRPAGGAWSNIQDMLKLVTMELSRGMLPDGKRYINEKPLLARREPIVAVGSDLQYGMGLVTDTGYGVPVVFHTGSLPGYKSTVFWLPEHGVGAVLLTNADGGRVLINDFRRKLQEVLFDGHPEADADIVTRGKASHEQIANDRKTLVFPAEEAAVKTLAGHYANEALGELTVLHTPGKPGAIFDFGEWKSPVATRKNPDGTISFVTTAPGVAWIADFLPGGADKKRTLVVRDAQHEYVFEEK